MPLAVVFQPDSAVLDFTPSHWKLGDHRECQLIDYYNDGLPNALCLPAPSLVHNPNCLSPSVFACVCVCVSVIWLSVLLTEQKSCCDSVWCNSGITESSQSTEKWDERPRGRSGRIKDFRCKQKHQNESSRLCHGQFFVRTAAPSNSASFPFFFQTAASGWRLTLHQSHGR